MTKVRPLVAVRPVVRDPEDIVFLSLRRDGHLVDESALEPLERALASATDCFLFCHGWLYDEADARAEAWRFFALLDQALASVRDGVVPLRVVLHWPSKPFGDPEPTRADGRDVGLWPALERHVEHTVRSGGDRGDIARLLLDLHAAEVPQSAEDAAELEALGRRVHAAERTRGMLPMSPLHALSFWVMKRRAGDVGERVAREHLAARWRPGPRGPRVHLVGHSFGAKLVTSMVLGGVTPASLTLLLGAFSAFAFAAEIPGLGRPGFYHRVLAERRVSGPIVVLHSEHDTALATLYRAIAGSGEIGRGPRLAPNSKRGSAARQVEVVLKSALGAVGARGVAAPGFDLLEAQRSGLPGHPIVNIDGSRVVRDKDPLVGAHRDIYHFEVARLVLLAAGLLAGGPDGLRPRPVSPLHAA
jgi:hypothetical protein